MSWRLCASCRTVTALVSLIIIPVIANCSRREVQAHHVCTAGQRPTRVQGFVKRIVQPRGRNAWTNDLCVPSCGVNLVRGGNKYACRQWEPLMRIRVCRKCRGETTANHSSHHEPPLHHRHVKKTLTYLLACRFRRHKLPSSLITKPTGKLDHTSWVRERDPRSALTSLSRPRLVWCSPRSHADGPAR